ncbi:ATP-dependent zinc metalloprotease FtsH [Streptomyces sp. enrichment culture]|uniref:ATP-binding protein n=1 Tax=Streptomyces sp. enrichment culture TaxID=1795815 RepID=UPI003F548064
MSAAAGILLDRLARLRREAAGLVAARAADDPTAHDPLRGLYVSSETALRAAADGPYAPSAATGGPGDVRADAAPESDADDGAGTGGPADPGGPDRLGGLVRAFGLSALDLRILLAAAAPDVDRRFEPLYGYLNDDVGRRRASVALALELAGTGPHAPRARARFHTAAPLLAGGLLLLEDEERPLPGRALRVPERVVAHLLGDDGLDAHLCAAGVVLLEPSGTTAPADGAGAADEADATDAAGAAEAADGGAGQGGAGDAIGGAVTGRADRADPAALVARAGRPVTVHLLDRRGEGGAERVIAALRAAGRTVLVHRPPAAAGAGDGGPGGDAPRLGPLLRREARLRGPGTAVVVAPVPAEPGQLMRSVAAPDTTTVFAGPDPYDPDWAPGVPLIPLEGARPHTAGAPRGTYGEAAALLGAGPAGALAAYRLSGEQLAEVARTARDLAALEGAELAERHVRLTARRLSAPLLGRLARRVRPAVGFADLVLPPAERARVAELATRARHRDEVLSGWRLRTGGGRGRGVVALFAGASGTGKTLAAEVVAGELGLDLYVVDLSSVVDKYVGETEKNLERIFTEADRTDAVLLFDEADAVFGKRSEVRGSHDRYANLESAYLLQRLESFDGIAVLTTNLRSNVDEAFTRRLDLVVDFPFPDAALRADLWRSALAGAPTGQDVAEELPRVAAEFELAGGSIRAAALTACYAARGRGGGPVTAGDVREGARREYVKAGRLLPGTSAPWRP